MIIWKGSGIIVYITLVNELFMGKDFITSQSDHCYLNHNTLVIIWKGSGIIVYITLANELFMGKCFITSQGEHCYGFK